MEVRYWHTGYWHTPELDGAKCPSVMIPQRAATNMTLGELFIKIETARALMSRANPQRLLLGQCEDALLALVTRLEAHAPPAASITDVKATT